MAGRQKHSIGSLGRWVAVVSAFALLAATCKSGGGADNGNPGGPRAVRSPAPRATGSLRTDGTRIVGPHGKALRLLGVNLQGLQFSNDQGSDRRDACNRAWHLPQQNGQTLRSYGFNTIRLPISWANIEPQPPTEGSGGSPTHHWNEDYLGAVDRVLDDLGQAKLAVILDMTQFHVSSAFKAGMGNDPGIQCEGLGYPAWMYPNARSLSVTEARCDFAADRAEPGVPQKPWDGVSAVWKMIGQRYRDRPGVVAADVLNEPFFQPQGCQGADFEGMYKAVGGAVRAVAPRWLLVFQYLPQAFGAFGIDSPPPFDNSVFSIHIYQPDWDAAKQEMSEDWTWAQRWKMPVLVGEFDAFARVALSGGDWQQQTIDMLDWMRDRSWSWTVFPYAGGAAQAQQGISAKQTFPELIRTLQQGL